MGKHIKKWDRCFNKLKKEKGESGAAAICSSSIDNAGLKAKNQKRDKKDYYSNKKKAKNESYREPKARYTSTDEDNYDVDMVKQYKNSDEFWDVAIENTIRKEFKGMIYPMCKTCGVPTKVKFTDERQMIGNDHQQIVICKKCGKPFVFETRYQVGYNNMERSGVLAEDAFSANATYPGPPLVNKLAGKMVGSGSDGILSSPRNTEIENGDDSVTSTGEFPLKYGDIKKQKVKSMQSRQRKSALKKIAKLNKMSTSGIKKMKSFADFSKKDEEENNG